MRNILVIIVGALVFVVIGAGIFLIFKKQPKQIACTQEAKICPDGTAVGRTGPNCEFAPCPVVADKGKGIIEGQITIGPICPVERIDNPCKPTPEMFAARKIFIYASDKKTLIAVIVPDSEGKFFLSLAEGNYYADTERRPGIGSVSGLPMTIKIEKDKITRLNIGIDTGIR